jgi:acyl carrier protein
MVDLKEDVRRFLLATFPMARKHKITYEESLLETGIVDSLGVLEIVNYLMDQLGVEVEDEDLTQENFQNIASIVNLIERKKNIA